MLAYYIEVPACLPYQFDSGFVEFLRVCFGDRLAVRTEESCDAAIYIGPEQFLLQQKSGSTKPSSSQPASHNTTQQQ
jgi:hypothetical protein